MCSEGRSMCCTCKKLQVPMSVTHCSGEEYHLIILYSAHCTMNFGIFEIRLYQITISFPLLCFVSCCISYCELISCATSSSFVDSHVEVL